MKKSTIFIILHTYVSWLECNHPDSLPPDCYTLTPCIIPLLPSPSALDHQQTAPLSNVTPHTHALPPQNFSSPSPPQNSPSPRSNYLPNALVHQQTTPFCQMLHLILTHHLLRTLLIV